MSFFTEASHSLLVPLQMPVVCFTAAGHAASYGLSSSISWAVFVTRCSMTCLVLPTISLSAVMSTRLSNIGMGQAVALALFPPCSVIVHRSTAASILTHMWSDVGGWLSSHHSYCCSFVIGARTLPTAVKLPMPFIMWTGGLVTGSVPVSSLSFLCSLSWLPSWHVPHCHLPNSWTHISLCWAHADWPVHHLCVSLKTAATRVTTGRCSGECKVLPPDVLLHSLTCKFCDLPICS